MRALVLTVTFLLLAGCFGEEATPDELRVSASAGLVSPGWAYDGARIEAGAGGLEGILVDSSNTGLVNVTFDFAGSHYVVTFDTFAQAAGKDFQDGGIEFEIDEHGETGVADASIPKIHAVAAAWGSAKVLKDGELAAPEPWSAHLMVSADTVRGTDGKIAKADGVTPYDPNAPADARRIEGDPQALFFIKHPQGETFSRAPSTVSTSLACAAPQCVQTAEIPLEEGAETFAFNFTFRPDGQLPLAAGRGAALVITDANGVEIARGGAETIAGPDPIPVTASGEFPAGTVGPLTATLTGDGLFGVTIDGAMTFDDRPFLVVTWDDVTVA